MDREIQASWQDSVKEILDFIVNKSWIQLLHYVYDLVYKRLIKELNN